MRSAAIVMVLLLTMFPVAFAQELKLTMYSGSDNVNGYANTEDHVTIKATAKIPGEEVIANTQVRLIVDNEFVLFDSCVKQGDLHVCTIDEPEFTAYEHLPFTIELRNDDGTLVNSTSATLVVDNLAPAIKAFDINPRTSTGAVTISYTVEDYALVNGDTSVCSGVKTVTITHKGAAFATDTYPVGTCTKINSYQKTLPSTGTTCITATDHLGKTSAPQCIDATIDNAGPIVNTAGIFDSNGNEITHSRTGQHLNSQIGAIISDDNIDNTQVFANVRLLNPGLPDDLPPTAVSGTLYTWQDIPITDASNCRFNIKAKDTFGNALQQEYTCSIKPDDTAPTVVGIVPEYKRGEIPLYGYDTDIIIAFEDKDNAGNNGTGLDGANAYLDLSSLGLGSDVKANSCVANNCAWRIKPNKPEGTYTIVVRSNTADDLGNELGTTKSFEIIFDNTGPAVPVITKREIFTGNGTANVAVKGVSVQYTVRSSNFTTGYADFTAVGGDIKTPPTFCSDTECTFTSTIELSGPYDAKINLTIYDDAGNHASVQDNLIVYGIDDELDNSYWNVSSVQCTPAGIDRETASVVPPFASCAITLSTSRTDITPITVTTNVDDCTGGDLYLNDLFLTNNYGNSTQPYAFIQLEPAEYDMNAMHITCPLVITSKRTAGGNYVSAVPQTLNATFSLGFYNSPLGNIHDNIDKKIRNAMDNSFAKMNWIGDLNKVMRYAEIICQIKNVISNLINAGYIVSIALGASADSVRKIPPVGPAAAAGPTAAYISTCNMEEQTAGWYKGIKEVLDKVCSVISCETTGSSGGKTDYGSFDSYLGTMPWCQDIEKLMKEYTAGGGAGGQFDFSSAVDFDIKDSLVLSAMCLCLPGIILNVEKMRQIECFKAVCYNDYVKEEGYPTSYCTQTYNYLWCTFVIGEMFAMNPFATFFEKLTNMAIESVSNPLIGISIAIGAVCTNFCFPEGTPGFTACAAYKTFNVVMEAVAQVIKMTDSKTRYWQPIGNKYCQRLEDIRDDFEE